MFGGSFAGETFKSVESYSVESYEWKMEEDMPRAAAHIQYAVVGVPKDLLKASFQSEVRK